MKATVLGSSGFIGSNLTTYLRGFGYEVATPGRSELAELKGSLGRVFYCIGMTGNFRLLPLATVDAHAGVLARLLETCEFESLVFFSSTRIYAEAEGPEDTQEEALIKVSPSANTTYDLSKMLGEALCLSLDQPSVKVIRLSNVYGPDQSKATFLGSLLEDLAQTGKASILESPDSSKDYVAISDVTSLAEMIARRGFHRTYNVASGQPVCHIEIAKTVIAEGLTCTFLPGGRRRVFPTINITRLKEEFDFTPRSLLDDLPQLLRAAGDSSAA
ncbi:NAD(P)-dependent oxidoreductase [uncultured Roseibium sp.]|uniref:NAD-dependent epimerase/dehydratase family protein n=1 Tax=uncultured Roseibium sp. TaxID=1936171 RepID=UPI00260B3852|nr:NAD(P)-dependent oxidoreductase [uncultured Roseibium sp.]